MRNDPAPWDDVEQSLAEPPTLTEEQTRDLVEAIPDDARAVMLTFRDPEAVARYARDGRAAMVARVNGLLIAQLEQRIDIGTAKVTPAVVGPEVRLVADIVDTLDAVKSIAQAGIDTAKAAGGDLLADVADVRPMGTTSERFPDGHGRDVRLEVSQASKATVNAEEVRDVLVEYLRHTLGPIDTPQQASQAEAFAEGVRTGIDAILGLGSVTWRSTALKALGAELATIPEQEAAALAIRLELAQGRTPVGDPRVKVERVDPAKRGGAR